MNKHIRELLCSEYSRRERSHVVFWSPFGCFVRYTADPSYGGQYERSELR